MIDIRPYRGSDAGDLALIFHDAVQRGTGNHYDQAQRNAWSPRCPAPHDWARRLAGGQTIVASTGGRSVGFMSWQEDGYLDLMFVHPDFMGRGIGDALYWVMKSG